MNRRFFSGEADVIDLHQESLPEWNGTGFKNETVLNVRARLKVADAVVVVAPEWNGMAPAALKNVFLWCGANQLAHKPALLVAISAGEGGALVISELRASSYKNSRLLYLPEHIIARHVEQLWSEAGGASDDYMQQRMTYATGLLKQYAEALSPIRDSLCEGLEDFTNGMS